MIPTPAPSRPPPPVKQPQPLNLQLQCLRLPPKVLQTGISVQGPQPGSQPPTQPAAALAAALRQPVAPAAGPLPHRRPSCCRKQGQALLPEAAQVCEAVPPAAAAASTRAAAAAGSRGGGAVQGLLAAAGRQQALQLTRDAILVAGLQGGKAWFLDCSLAWPLAPCVLLWSNKPENRKFRACKAS